MAVQSHTTNSTDVFQSARAKIYVDVPSRCEDNNSSSSGLYSATMLDIPINDGLAEVSPPTNPPKLYMMSKVLSALMIYYIMAASRTNINTTIIGLMISVWTIDDLQVPEMCVYCNSTYVPGSVTNNHVYKHGNNCQRHSVTLMVHHQNWYYWHLNLMYTTAGASINFLSFIYTTPHTSSSM